MAAKETEAEPLTPDQKLKKLPLEQKKEYYERSKEVYQILGAELGMPDDNVTKLDLVRRDLNDTRKEFNQKIEEREETDEELQAKLKELDAKQCKGEECYTRIEKQQADILKLLEEKMQRLEAPLYVCSNCGIGTMRKGDLQCPHCGAKVKNWA